VDLEAGGTIQVMSASLMYLFLRQLVQMLTQPARDGGAADIELLVLRHQVVVLRARYRFCRTFCMPSGLSSTMI
jgi:hypothetical protein